MEYIPTEQLSRIARDYRKSILLREGLTDWSQWLDIKSKKRDERVQAFLNRPRIRIKRTKQEIAASQVARPVAVIEEEVEWVNESALLKIMSDE